MNIISCIVIKYRYEYHNSIVIIWQSKTCLAHLNKPALLIRRDILSIYWYLQRVISFLRFVFIVKWNIKHNTNDLQNTYKSVYHSISQYQAFSSIYRYHIMYIICLIIYWVYQ